MIVIKVGGNELDSPAFLRGLARAVAALPQRPVIVHGGGRGTTQLAERFGLEPRFVEGLRVTDELTLKLAVMGMIGEASSQVVAALVGEGLAALGLSGLDAALVTADPLRVAAGELGAVGHPVAVDALRLRSLLDAGFLPCLAPICRSADGALLNVNADHVAQAVAAALGAEMLLFLTNVPAVRVDGQPVATLTPGQVEREIARGSIAGGMIPKSRAAVAAVAAGVERALITDLAGLDTIARGGPAGTAILKSHNNDHQGAFELDAQEIIELEQRYLVQSYRRPPFVLERGEGAYLFDSEGRRYLDMVGGIAVNALGYGDAGMQEVMQAQAAALLHVSNLYHTAPHVELARKLVENSFADRVFFCNSGTEAIEGALKFARKWARRTSGDEAKCEVLSFTHAFHGRSMGALATTANPAYRAPFEPLIGGVSFATYNDLESARALIGPTTAAVIVEPLQGEGGITAAREPFLRGLRALCDEHGAALIFDEIQCGLGRTGTLWAYEAAGVQPELMAVAKPLGGGLPIGAILLTEKIASAIEPGDHGSTFAGGPFVTAVAGHVFDRIADSAFLEHIQEVGGYLGEQLSELAGQLPAIRDVRGRGLMWGIELDEALPAAEVVRAGYEHGLLLVGAGRNTIRFVPPLIIERAQVDELVGKLQRLFASLDSR